MTPDKEQTMGGEEWTEDPSAHPSHWSTGFLAYQLEQKGDHTGWDLTVLAAEAARRLRRGGEVEMHGEIRKKPWRWRVCAECHYSDWALDADYRVCNDCGSPRVTDYVPTDPTPTSEKEREPTDMIADRALQKVVEEGWSDEQYAATLENVALNLRQIVKHPDLATEIDPDTARDAADRLDSLARRLRSTPDGSERDGACTCGQAADQHWCRVHPYRPTEEEDDG